jgi:hypothetical protein
MPVGSRTAGTCIHGSWDPLLLASGVPRKTAAMPAPGQAPMIALLLVLQLALATEARVLGGNWGLQQQRVGLGRWLDGSSDGASTAVTASLPLSSRASNHPPRLIQRTWYAASYGILLD